MDDSRSLCADALLSVNSSNRSVLVSTEQACDLVTKYGHRTFVLRFQRYSSDVLIEIAGLGASGYSLTPRFHRDSGTTTWWLVLNRREASFRVSFLRVLFWLLGCLRVYFSILSLLDHYCNGMGTGHMGMSWKFFFSSMGVIVVSALVNAHAVQAVLVSLSIGKRMF